MVQARGFDPADPGPRRAIEAALSDRVLAGLRDTAAGTATVALDLALLVGDLRRLDLAGPRALDDVIAWAIDALRAGIVPTTHPRYLGCSIRRPASPPSAPTGSSSAARGVVARLEQVADAQRTAGSAARVVPRAPRGCVAPRRFEARPRGV